MTTRQIPLKQWFREEAERQDITPWGLQRRYYAGAYRGKLELVRVNKRVIFVVVPLGVNTDTQPAADCGRV